MLMRLFFILFIITFQISPANKLVTVHVLGTAQGTTYHITYRSTEGLNYKREIDSILAELDTSLSTYIPESIISRMNRNDANARADQHFITVFRKSMEVSKRTVGLFDVTVAPLINAYGFGFTKKAQLDSITIDSLRRLIGYKQVSLKDGKLTKSRPEVMLDFNAIAQGYSVDVICQFLESKNVRNYIVELGGEVRARGKNDVEAYWKVGVDEPSVNENRLQTILSLKNVSLATSGNYKRFYIENGKRYAHIINPHTGYPAKHNLLSATVIAPDCMTADAYATAFIVMGLSKTKKFLEKNKDLKLEVYLIYDENGIIKTYSSKK